jgi:dipeptidyl aminopeptidase/acylaminoacyl peptidase
VADALTRDLLRPAEFERIVISPNARLLAMAEHRNGKTVVTLRRRGDLAPLIAFDPGSNGAISDLRWIDDPRLNIGATGVRAADGIAAFAPALMIVRVDGGAPFVLPGNFFGTLPGDPDHLLISTCGFQTATSGCTVPEIRKNDIGHLTRRGELVSSGPPGTQMLPDYRGNGRFAIGYEDDGTGRTWVFDLRQKKWRLLNDASKTGLEMRPLSVAADGRSGLLQSQRRHGTDVVESYDFATGKRTSLVTDAGSDPLTLLRSVDRKRFIGALYNPTQPRARYWDEHDPDSRLAMALQAAFPGRLAAVTSVSRDGNFAVLWVTSDRDPGAFYLFDRRARKAALIARSRPWIDIARQASQRGFDFSARDGLALHGLLTLPPGAAGKDLPMVVLPHGGPYEITDLWGYDPETQILAQHGYAVLQVNFRGSGGYGREFTDAGARQWGRKMQDDVSDATRWAIAQGIADPRRICIYGASYGGYAALMGVIREPGLYRCAVGRSGVFDLSKMYKWGSIRRGDVGKAYLRRVLGEDQAELAANSPALLADRITAPVLLVHGTRDARVDVKHARLMARELARRHKPVQLVEYSATGHALMLERHRQDFYARLLAFLDEHSPP